MSREALSFPVYMPFLLFSKEGIRVKLAFTKMHGCGNNYIYFNCFDQTVPDPESLSIKLSEPHFGIGGDGIILISPSDKADAQMDKRQEVTFTYMVKPTDCPSDA